MRKRIDRIVPLVLAALLFGGCSSGADSTADKFMSLLVQGEHLEAQEMLSKDMRAMATLLGGVSNQSLNPYYRSGQLKSYTLTTTEKTDNAVRYRVSAVTLDGKVHEDFLDMIHEDGKWKVSRF
jgi:hypothetical protein